MKKLRLFSLIMVGALLVGCTNNSIDWNDNETINYSSLSSAVRANIESELPTTGLTIDKVYVLNATAEQNQGYRIYYSYEKSSQATYDETITVTTYYRIDSNGDKEEVSSETTYTYTPTTYTYSSSKHSFYVDVDVNGRWEYIVGNAISGLPTGFVGLLSEEDQKSLTTMDETVQYAGTGLLYYLEREFNLYYELEDKDDPNSDEIFVGKEPTTEVSGSASVQLITKSTTVENEVLVN